MYRIYYKKNYTLLIDIDFESERKAKNYLRLKRLNKDLFEIIWKR